MPLLNFPSLDMAMAEFEGIRNPNSLVSRTNNPGALQYGPFTRGMGAIGSYKGFAVFPDWKTGLYAQDAKITEYADKGYTLDSLINAWSPANAPGNTPQSTENYKKYVADSTGHSIFDSLKSFLSDPTNSVKESVGNKITTSFVSGLFPSLSDLSFFVIGALCIAGGLFLFSGTKETVIQISKAATKAAGVIA